MVATSVGSVALPEFIYFYFDFFFFFLMLTVKLLFKNNSNK